MQVGKRMMEFDFNPRSPHGERREAAAALRRGAEFQSTLPARGATRHCNPADAPQPEIFQPTLPARGATVGADVLFHPAFRISIHAPRTGSDTGSASAWAQTAQFQSTLPARGATPSGQPEYASPQISIHAPRTGSDPRFFGGGGGGGDFNPRSPHGERPARSALRSCCSAFQPTLPARGATYAVPSTITPARNFNPRSPHGERPRRFFRHFRVLDFNPRSPHGERHGRGGKAPHGRDFNPRSPHGERRKPVDQEFLNLLFQSTLPARGATRKVCDLPKKISISIHAPRTGSDTAASTASSALENFNPRSPHGERRVFPFCSLMGRISIHAPRTGSDKYRSIRPGTSIYFNPRSPHGERRMRWNILPSYRKISIHAPRTGSDVAIQRPRLRDNPFQSTLPARGATPMAGHDTREF